MINEEIFTEIIEEIKYTGENLRKVLKKYHTNCKEFYKFIDEDVDKRGGRYATARLSQVDNRVQLERDRINEKAMIDILKNPKCSNAIASMYKDIIRQAEWDAVKLLPKKYGDKVDLGIDNKVNIVMVSNKLNEKSKEIDSQKQIDSI